MPADIDTLLSLAREVGGRIGACPVWDRGDVFQRPTATLDANQLAVFAERIRQDEREKFRALLSEASEFWHTYSSLSEQYQNEMAQERNAMLDKMDDAIRSSGTSQSNPLRGGGNG